MRSKDPSGGWLIRGTASLILLAFLSACYTIRYAPEAPPPKKVESMWKCKRGHVWVPGHWVWKDNRYSWLPGYCKKRPRAKALWIPGQWEEHPKGWVWIPGHWKG